MRTKPRGKPKRGNRVRVGHIPEEKSSLSIPVQVPIMIEKNANTLTPTMLATMVARMRSHRDGSEGLCILTSTAYPPGRRGILGVLATRAGPWGSNRESNMPTGKVKFYDTEKGFGFIQSDDGDEVFLPSSAVDEGAVVKSGSRVEFGVVEGKRGAQALTVRVLETPHLARMDRKSADDMGIIVEDLVKILDRVGGGLRKGHYPDREFGRKVAAMLRRVADDFDG